MSQDSQKFIQTVSGKLGKQEFHKLYRHAVKTHKDDLEVFDALFTFVKDENELAQFEKLSDFIDAFTLYP